MDARLKAIYNSLTLKELWERYNRLLRTTNKLLDQKRYKTYYEVSEVESYCWSLICSLELMKRNEKAK